jgi:predicted RNase H-like HicB family nuclease
MPEEDEKKREEDEDVEKGDAEQEMPELTHSESNISSVLERIGNLEKAFEEMNQVPEPTGDIGKGEDEEETMEEKKEDKEVEKCSGPVKKADEVDPETKEEGTEPTVTDYITKATFNDEIKKALAQIDTIQKAYDDLKERVDKMEEFAIQKGGNIVFIKEDGATDNPMIDNLNAVEG